MEALFFKWSQRNICFNDQLICTGTMSSANSCCIICKYRLWTCIIWHLTIRMSVRAAFPPRLLVKSSDSVTEHCATSSLVEKWEISAWQLNYTTFCKCVTSLSVLLNTHEIPTGESLSRSSPACMFKRFRVTNTSEKILVTSQNGAELRICCNLNLAHY